MAIGGIIGGIGAIRSLFAASTAIGTPASHSFREFGSTFLRSPILQGGAFGVGYTGGAYAGYGVSNTIDPLGIHKPKYSSHKSNLGLPYGSYGRRRYSRGDSGYSRYSRRSYYRRRRPYYSRRSYY